MPTPLKKINDVIATVLRAQSFTASLGSISSDSVWAQVTPKALNGNAILILPGPATNQVVLKASAMVMSVPLAGIVKVEVGSDTAITSVTTPPVGARTNGTNYFFSQFTSWNEPPVLMAGKFNHIYMVYDVTKTNNMAIGIITSASVDDPSPALLPNLGISVSARQAVCYAGATGLIASLTTFPAIFNQTAAVVADAAASFADWGKEPTEIVTNAIQVQFSFPAGVGTGSVGELAVKIGPDIIAFLAISPQLLKDADVPLVLKWNLMIGEPGAFLA